MAMFGSVLVLVLDDWLGMVFFLLSVENPDVWIGVCIPQVNLYMFLSGFHQETPMFGSGPPLAFWNAGTDPNIGVFFTLLTCLVHVAVQSIREEEEEEHLGGQQ